VRLDELRHLEQCLKRNRGLISLWKLTAMNWIEHELGQLRRQLGGGSGWLDEIHYQLKPRIASLNDDFKQMLDGLSDDDLKKGAVIAEVKQRAKELGELNRDLGDDGAWSAEINEEIERRLK
jgi:hypothetical protein